MKLVKDVNKDSPNKPQVSDKEAEEAIKKLIAVSYTHLTLPTILLV